jgi:sensor histidine kinase YesM
VTRQDFIFSNEQRHRIARHLAFWGGWCVAYLLLFQYPIHAFDGWSLNESTGPFDDIRQYGLPLFVLRTLIFNSLLMVVVPQAIFTCVLIYWVLPNYFFKKRNVFVVAFILISVFVIYYFIASLFKASPPLGAYIFGLAKDIPKLTLRERWDMFMYSALREQLSSLPLIAGFAVMIKLIKRWWLKQKQTEQLFYEKTKAELQLLKAQVHPHFLFNTLNNIYYFTLAGSPKAPEMINKLSGLLYYILNECNQPLIPLQREINMLRDYMALEKIRYGEQMGMTIDIQEKGSEKLIAPLLLIPFVENSFKHGTSKMLAHPWLKLQITMENNVLHFSVANSRPPKAETQLKKGNIGLKNVKKRLELLYPGTHELNIVSRPESFFVDLKVQLQEAKDYVATNEEIKTANAYAMA